MLQEIWHTVQFIWNDPVWSKVISAGILLIIPTIFAYCRGWFPIISQWLASEIIIPKLSVIAFFLMFVALSALGMFGIKQRDQCISELDEEVTKRDKTLKQWSVEGQNAIKRCEDALEGWKNALEGWKKQNSELQRS